MTLARFPTPVFDLKGIISPFEKNIQFLTLLRVDIYQLGEFLEVKKASSPTVAEN